MKEFPTKFAIDISNLPPDEQERLLASQREFEEHYELVKRETQWLSDLKFPWDTRTLAK